MQIEFSLQSRDLFRMLRHIHGGQYPYRSKLFYGLSIACIFYSAYVLVDPGQDVRIFYMSALLPLFYLAILPMALLIRAKGMWKKESYFQGKFKYRFDDKGIFAESGAGKGLVKWKDITKAFQTRDDLLFYVSKTQAFIVPKYALGDHQVKEMLEIIEKNLEESKLQL